MPLPLLLPLVLPLLVGQTTGVKIEDTKPGLGDPVVSGDVVEVRYVGTLKDGKEFDRSKEAPFRLQVGVGMVIRGWDEGLLGMKTGGTRKLDIPAALAYGDRSPAPTIPANSDLKFEVSVIRILPRAKVETTKPPTDEKAVAVVAGDGVEFTLTTSLEDGKKLPSGDGKTPITAPMAAIGRALPALNQGLIGMRPGERRKITASAALAMTEAGIPAADTTDPETGAKVIKASIVPAGASLVYEVELLRVVTKKAPVEKAPGEKAPGEKGGK